MISNVVIAPFARWHSTNRRAPQVVPSLTCAGLTASHDAVDPKPYVVGADRPFIVVTACRGCIEVIGSLTHVAPDRRR